MGIKNFLTMFQPKSPQTGDGWAKRDIYDTPKNVQRDAAGKKLKPAKKK